MTSLLPIWQAEWSQTPPVELPSALVSWLLETGSLTTRLKQCAGRFSLQLLGEWQEPLPDFLQARWGCLDGMRREVLLCLDDIPHIYAQSFWPLATQQALAPLAQLGAMPLGELIFANPQIRRSAIETAAFDQRFAIAMRTSTSVVYGRRSYFALDKHELLVQEVFLSQGEMA